MSVLKCKMCGGTLSINANQTTGTCEYCGTEQTFSKSRDEVIQNLFSRANTLRLRSEFDKAQDVYEKIVAADSTDSEGFWGIVLCKYGIEYVEDPKMYRRIPTCHRTQIESVLTDVDYLSAIQNADEQQRVIYQNEAKEIDRLQKDILKIADKETPFDVFICYKETDQYGKRTADSVFANDIYHQLTQEGFKVFYAAITLEEKLGTEYEPYIFAALNSAKVMLVIGSKPEYFNAPWVKNEWSRFLKIIKKDRNKILIPCFRDMDAYDLPEEFSLLQAQDMGKIGFINDIVRGIKKVIAPVNIKQPEPSAVSVSAVPGASPTVVSYLERVAFFLHDEKYDMVLQYCDKILDINPKCADAFFYKVITTYIVNKNTDTPEIQKNLYWLEKLSPDLTAAERTYIEDYSIVKLFRLYGGINSLSRMKILYGIDPETISQFFGSDVTVGNAIMVHAVLNKKKDIINFLLDCGANVNAFRIYKNKFGSTVYSILGDAIWNLKDVEIVSTLLERGADVNRIETVYCDNGTVEKKSMLAYAICNAKNTEIVKLLVENGADVNYYRVYKSNFGETKHSMLNDAVWCARSVGIIKLLLDNGADPNSYRVYINRFGQSVYSALSDAIWNAKNIEMVNLLLSYRADANRVETVIDDTGVEAVKSMLTYAIVDAKSIPMIDALLQYGATWENKIKYDGYSKSEKHFPYPKINDVSADILKHIKASGWKGFYISFG